jgi:ABC-type multidrug transport system fused ATPase/permease subunit
MMCAMPYPVTIDVESQIANRNRLTVAFRLLLAIPHFLLVGGIGLGFALSGGRSDLSTSVGETGFLGAVAYLLAIVSWFTIVIGGSHITAIRQYTTFYLRWRVRALAYLMLLEDRYPPFGDATYPASLTFVDTERVRNRLTVGFRLILIIPHMIVVGLLSIAWWVTTFVAWCIILFTGNYPQGLYDFGVGVLRWFIRVEAYLLLLVDEYPPFSFE